jgi:hypothetical protein
MKEPEPKPVGKSKQGMHTGNKSRGDSNVKTLKKWRKKPTVVNINGKKIKEVDKFVYLGSVVEKTSKIRNKTNQRI